VSATFSKVKVRRDEPPHETLARCIAEQIGQFPDAYYPIPTVWTTANSAGYYFTGMLGNDGGLPEYRPLELSWCNTAEAERRIGGSNNAVSRQRDLAILSSAKGMCLSPYRRVLLMLSELHNMGCERLRAPAYDYPLAWRCPIVPKSWTLKRHGGLYDPAFDAVSIFGRHRPHHTYSSASGQQPFQWKGVAFSTPRELAKRFVEENREVAFAGWGPDSKYTQWFTEVLRMTEPNGLYYAFAEFEEPTSFLYTRHTHVKQIPLPPPGLALKDEFKAFAQTRRGDD
jgi:hypothetical protein